MPTDDYNIEDGNDPLDEFLSVDIDKMTPEELSAHIATLNEVAENPKAVRRIVAKKEKEKKTITLDKLLEL
jgi:hypothetical protein